MIAAGRARTQITEIDLSERVPSFPGIYIAMALNAAKGPYTPTLVTSDTQLLQDYTLFEKVQVGDDLAFFNAAAVLEKNNKLWIIRAEDGATYGGCTIAQDKPFNTVGVTFNDNLNTVILRHITESEQTIANIASNSISTGEVVTLLADSTSDLPSGLSLDTKYYLIPYNRANHAFRLATSYETATKGEYIEFTGTGDGAVQLSFNNDRRNAGISGVQHPEGYQFNTSDGKLAGIDSEFVVDTDNSQISVSEKFYNAIQSGSELELIGEDSDMPVADVTLQSGMRVFALPVLQEGENKKRFKINICATYNDYLNEDYIRFSSTAGDTFGIKLADAESVCEVGENDIDFVTDAITVSENFFSTVEDGDRCKLYVNAGGNYPSVSGSAELNADDNYYIIKGVSNMIQIATTKNGSAINFTTSVTDPDTLTIELIDKVISSNGTIDLSNDSLQVSEAYYDMAETGFPCVVSSDGTLPKGLVAGKTYYIIKTKTPKVIKLADTVVNAELNLPVDILDAGAYDSELGQYHIIRDTHSDVYTGYNQNCMLITSKTATSEEIYVTLVHYPYGDESTWTEDEAALARTLEVPNSFRLSVFKKYEDGSLIEVERFLMSRHQDQMDYNQTNIYVDEVAKRSKYINVYNNTDVSEEIYPANQSSLLKLQGGSSGGTTTTGGMIAAIQKIASTRRYTANILIDGGYTVPAYQQTLVSLAESRQFTVALLSTRLSDELSANAVNDVLYYRNYELATNSSYAALYSPHVRIYDKFNNREIYVAPVGHVAANISNTAETLEAWYPVAGNSTRGTLDVLGLSHIWEDGEEDLLYENQINPIDYNINRGIRIWGQRTLLRKTTALDRLNVRMLLIVLEPSLKDYLDDFLFEINDEITRSLALTGLNTLMESIKARRGVYDYNVICDSSNNTDEIIDQHMLVVDIYVQPTQSLEYVNCRVVVQRTGSSVTLSA